MRICLVSREMAPFWGAGIGTYVASMARAWSGAGHEVHVLGVNEPEAGAKGVRLFPGVRFHDTDPLREPDDRTLWRSEVAKRSQQVRRTLHRLHAAHRFDYIEFPEYYAEGAFAIRGAWMLGELPGATLGVRLHSPDRLCRALNADPVLGFNRLLTDRLEMESVALADVVISPTASLLEWCREELRAGGQAIRGHACVVPYPFDVAGFADRGGPWTDPEIGRAGHRVPQVLYFGRLERRKGVDILIDAFNILAERGIECGLRMVGGDTKTGPGGSSIREHLILRLDAAARDRVVFEDRLSREELIPIIRATVASGGLCCFPSRWENFPNVLLESMALGAPVVAADAGGMAEIVQHGHSGLLFGSGDPEALADAIMLVLADRSLRDRMAANAPAQIRSLCGPERVVQATIAAIEQGRPFRAGRAMAQIESGGPVMPEIEINGPGAWRDLEQVLAKGEVSTVLFRRAGATADPRFVASAERILRSHPSIAVVTAHVAGSTAQESWVPLGLDRAALAALDLSGLGALACVRVEALASVRATIEDGLAALGPAAGPKGLTWVIAAALCARGWMSVTLPEPWIGGSWPDQPFAISPSSHRARVLGASILEGSNAIGHDAARLLASVLAPNAG